MSQASTDMRKYQMEFARAVTSNFFTPEQVKAMLLSQVSTMNTFELEDMLAAVAMDRYDLPDT